MDITKIKYAAIFLIFVMVYSFGNVYAQGPAKVFKGLDDTRQEQQFLKKEAPDKGAVIQKEADVLEKQMAAPDKKVFVKRFQVEGNTRLSESVIASMIAPYEGKQLTIDEINGVAGLITAKYREAGYLTTRAYVPAQEIKDNVVVIRAADGRIGDIIAAGNKSYSDAFIKKHMAGAKKDGLLNEKNLERSILLLNGYQDLNVTASLKAGKDPGTTDVIARVTDKFPFAASIFYDNYGEKLTSKNRAGFTIDAGNLITSGDEINLFGITGIDDLNIKDLAYGRIEYSLPIGGNGTRVGAHYGHSVYDVDEELDNVLKLADIDIDGGANTAGIYVSHPFIKQAGLTVAARLGFDYGDFYQKIDGQDDIADDIRKSSLGITCDWADAFSGVNYFGLTYVRGLNSLLGGSESDDPNVSRLDGDVDFNKFTVDLVRMQKLPGYNHLMLKASGQYSADELSSPEQFSIGGIRTVRGFKSSERNGDMGYALTAELSLSPFFADKEIFGQKVGDSVKFAFFGDYGWVKWNNYEDVALSENEDLGSIGAGVRLYLGKRFSFRLDYAMPYIDGKFKSDSDSRTYLQATVNF